MTRRSSRTGGPPSVPRDRVDVAGRVRVRRRAGRADVDVRRALEMRALRVEVREGDRDVGGHGVLDPERGLVDERVLEARVEDEDRRLRQDDSVGIDAKMFGYVGCAAPVNVSVWTLMPLFDMRRADHDRGRAAVEHAVAAAHDGLVLALRRPREARRGRRSCSCPRGRRSCRCRPRGAGRRGSARAAARCPACRSAGRGSASGSAWAPLVLGEERDLREVRVRVRARSSPRPGTPGRTAVGVPGCSSRPS